MSRYEQLKTILMDKNLCETTDSSVKTLNSKRQLKGKLGHVVKRIREAKTL